MLKFFAKAAAKNRGEIFMYDEIGSSWDGQGITAKSFADALKALGTIKALDVYMNSPGGSVFEGLAIYNQMKRFDGEKVVHIDGIAASIASVIAMAGDEIRIAANGTVMIHDPWGMAIGSAADMRKQADSLDKIRDTLLSTYVARTGGKSKEISDWMAAETWMNADEAVARGFATSKTDEKQFSAAFTMLAKFKNVPEPLKQQAKAPLLMQARMDMRTKHLTRRPAGVTA